MKRIVGIHFQEPHFNKIIEIENGKIMGQREKLHRGDLSMDALSTIQS